MVGGLLYCMIGVNVLIGFFLIGFLKSPNFINGVVHPTIFLFESTIVIVVIFIVFKLTVPNLTMVDSRRLRVVRPVPAFVLLVVGRLASTLLAQRPTV